MLLRGSIVVCEWINPIESLAGLLLSDPAPRQQTDTAEGCVSYPRPIVAVADTLLSYPVHNDQPIIEPLESSPAQSYVVTQPEITQCEGAIQSVPVTRELPFSVAQNTITNKPEIAEVSKAAQTSHINKESLHSPAKSCVINQPESPLIPTFTEDQISTLVAELKIQLEEEIASERKKRFLYSAPLRRIINDCVVKAMPQLSPFLPMTEEEYNLETHPYKKLIQHLLITADAEEKKEAKDILREYAVLVYAHASCIFDHTIYVPDLLKSATEFNDLKRDLLSQYNHAPSF